MPYRAPVSEYAFVLTHVVGFDAVQASPRFGDCTPDLAHAILAEAGKLSEGTLAPLNRIGDKIGAKMENGAVTTPPGFRPAYAQIAQGGYIGMAGAPEYGGMGLPAALVYCTNEMMGSACLALQLNPLMAQGQIEALEHHASDEMKALYLPRLISGQWAATMNLTEPQAGSDVGALRTRAEDLGDGTYAITGQKIYITWGEHDLAENICHLVLARLPDGAEGTKGISLFLVPKFIPNADGSLGARNGARAISLEHKLGLHGSPTAVMEYDRAIGWMVGAPHKGMAAMFTMMNNARLGVAGQGIAIAEAATQTATEFAMTRRQGRTPMGETAIIDHADVRRMLGQMRAETFAARAIALSCAAAMDMAAATGLPEWATRAAFLTPIAKAYGTDIGAEVAHIGVQVHGGMGVIEETGAAQFMRDVRVTSIYEGTNGIQALDLVGRKMADGGVAAMTLLDEMASLATQDTTDLGAALGAAINNMRAATQRLLAQDTQDRSGGAVPYLRAFARVLGAGYHLRAAMADPARRPLAAFYIQRLLPEHAALLASAAVGAAGLYALGPDALGLTG
ncbi:MAG: acyl-CoA dehydrogenase [Cypionkella sp.]|nr:acyl-CoA dehydrogenase [Cypionkella sp.]